MVKVSPQLVVWCFVYLMIALAPLIGGVVNLAHGRGFWLNFSIALGFLALSIFGLQFVNILRIRLFSQPIGMLGAFLLHRYMSYIATAFTFLHLFILLGIDKKYWALLNVMTSPLRAKFAVAATLALIALMITSIWRSKLKLRYRRWHLIHWVLALMVFGFAITHAYLVNYYLEDRLEQNIWISIGALFVLAGLWTRFGNPVFRLRRRWVVDKVQEPIPHVFEIDIKPAKSERKTRKPFAFKPGQFVWLIAERSPFSISANPFTIAISAKAKDHLRFIIRANEGYTNALRDLEIGKSVYIDGPHGDFTPDPNVEGPLIMIGAGVGVTPFISMIETMADEGSKRRMVLILANRKRAGIIGADQIDAVKGRVDLDVYHYIREEEAGRMDEDFIRSCLPKMRERGSVLFVEVMLL